MKKLTIAILMGFVFSIAAGTFTAGQKNHIAGFCFLFPSLSIAPAVEEEPTEELSDDDGEVKIIVAEQTEPPEVRFWLLDWFEGVFLDS